MSILLSEDAWKSAKAVFGIKPAPQNSQDSNLFKHHRSMFRDDVFHKSMERHHWRHNPNNPSSPMYDNRR
jgi:hypothetical protein